MQSIPRGLSRVTSQVGVASCSSRGGSATARLLPAAALRTAFPPKSCLRGGPSASATVAVAAVRFASGAASKVSKTLGDEIKHEEEQYEKPKEAGQFLKETDFKLIEVEGDVNMALEREFGNKVVRVEWQLTSPFDPIEDGEQDEGGESFEQEATDFCVTIESRSSGAGLTFYCSTQTGEDHRYVIGNVKSFASAEEKDSASGYNGPEFEDIDEQLQEAFDEYLSEAGVSSQLCDFIDAMALDKEQREYVRWLKTVKGLMDI